jgi:hypothetical protein
LETTSRIAICSACQAMMSSHCCKEWRTKVTSEIGDSRVWFAHCRRKAPCWRNQHHYR